MNTRRRFGACVQRLKVGKAGPSYSPEVRRRSVDASPPFDGTSHVPALQVLDPGDLPSHSVEGEPVAQLRGAPQRDRRDAGLVAAIENNEDRVVLQVGC